MKENFNQAKLKITATNIYTNCFELNKSGKLKATDTESLAALVLTSSGQMLKCSEAVPDERVSFLRENSDFHYLAKRGEGLAH